MIAGGSLQASGTRLGLPYGTAASATFNLRHRLAAAGALRELQVGLQRLADHLDAVPHLVDYHRRRHALATWSLPQADWHRLSEHLPERTSRRFNDDVRRNTAAVLIWMEVTQGQSHQAPLVHQARAAAHPARSPLLVSIAETGSQRRNDRAWDLRPIAADLDAYALNLAAKIDQPSN
ncbi:hypothetical protein [Kitasatospora indigofera]|uniref:hypothetical protein n=1 Tax=Kitasatospora indigofera TaxID=67307 RepID=UPI0033AFA381